MTLELTTLSGSTIIPYTQTIAELELKVLSEFPYLYETHIANQIQYVERFIKCKESIIILIRDGDKVVGLSSGIPLSSDSDFFKTPFIENNIDVEDVYYLGESVLLPDYRGKGLYRDFFIIREAAALKHGCTICSFISVQREANDERQPLNYKSLDQAWKHFGYEKRPELSLELEWKDIGDNISTKKKMVYWVKYLVAR